MAPINWPAAYAAAHDLWLDACHAQAGMPKSPGAAEGPAEDARQDYYRAHYQRRFAEQVIALWNLADWSGQLPVRLAEEARLREVARAAGNEQHPKGE